MPEYGQSAFPILWWRSSSGPVEALMPKRCLFADYSLSAALTAPLVVWRAPACDRHIEHQSIEASS
jgi:hypothetical protein